MKQSDGTITKPLLLKVLNQIVIIDTNNKLKKIQCILRGSLINNLFGNDIKLIHFHCFAMQYDFQVWKRCWQKP